MISNRDRMSSILLGAVAVVLFLGAAEGILRLKNSSMQNYDIEMWRYARASNLQQTIGTCSGTIM